MRAAHNGRAKNAVHFTCYGDVLATCSSDVPAVFRRPLEHRLNVAATKILGLGDTTLFGLFAGWDVGGACTPESSGCTTPGPYPRRYSITATYELCAGFGSPTSTPFGGSCNASFGSIYTPSPKIHCRGRRDDGDAPSGTLVTWVIGPGSGRTAPLPNGWLPSHAQVGKFLTAMGHVAGSCHWQLICERSADHHLGA